MWNFISADRGNTESKERVEREKQGEAGVSEWVGLERTFTFHPVQHPAMDKRIRGDEKRATHPQVT